MTLVDWATSLSAAEVAAVKHALHLGQLFKLNGLTHEQDPAKRAAGTQELVASLTEDQRGAIRAHVTPEHLEQFHTITGIAI